MTRADKVARARALREGGLLLREIAELMGAAISTVDAWLNDPDGSRLRARKDRYRGTCVTCGSPTDGSGGATNAPVRCAECRNRELHEGRHWTRERVAAVLREWAAQLGRAPSANEAKAAGAPVASSLVVREFGSWRAGLTAAGLEARGPGHYGRFGEAIDPDGSEAERLYRDGWSSRKIAEHQGVNPDTVRYRLRRRGVPIRTRSEAARVAHSHQAVAA